MNPARLILIYVVLAAAAALAVLVVIERVGRRRRRVETRAEIGRVAAAAFGLRVDEIEVGTALDREGVVVVSIPRPALVRDVDGRARRLLTTRIRRHILVEPRDATSLDCDRCRARLTTFSTSAVIDAGWLQVGDRWRCDRCGGCRP